VFDHIGKLAFLAVLLVGGGITAVSYEVAHHDQHVAACTVTSKDRSAKSDSDSRYRIYTNECGVLADEDSLWFGKTHSADLYGQLVPGHTYQLEVAGYRSGLASIFPNIIRIVTEVPAPTSAPAA
jgi:hypothetical protein